MWLTDSNWLRKFLLAEDILARNPVDDDWIIVYEYWTHLDEGEIQNGQDQPLAHWISLVCSLMVDPSEAEDLVEQLDNIQDLNKDGRPFFDYSSEQDPLPFKEGLKVVVKGTPVETLFIHPEHDERLRIRYDLAFYYDNVEVEPNKFVRYEDDTPVIRYEQQEDRSGRTNQRVTILKGYLRDFLAAKGKALILGEYHGRWGRFVGEISSDLPKRMENKVEPFGRMTLIAADHIPPKGAGWQMDFHRFLVLWPFERPRHPASKPWRPNTEEEEPEPFYFTIDSEGKQVDVLGKEIRHQLLPGFFRREVLDKYYKTPGSEVSWGAPGLGSINYKGLWHLVIGVNRNGEIFTWLHKLGEIGKYHPQELHHWKAYELGYQTDINPNFWRTQIEGQFPRGLHVNEEIARTIQRINGLLPDPLILLDKESEEIMQRLHEPIRGTKDEFIDTMLEWDKLLNEALNKKFLKSLVKDLKGINNLGTIGLLGAVLTRFSISEAEREAVTKPLRYVNDFRQRKGHRGGEEKLQATLVALGFSKPSNFIPVYRALLEKVKSALLLLENLLVSAVIPDLRLDK